jgi:hypothetical protein
MEKKGELIWNNKSPVFKRGSRAEEKARHYKRAARLQWAGGNEMCMMI